MDDSSSIFFRTIGSVPGDLRKLMIDPAFTKEFGSIFPDTTYLRAGGGKEYKVKIEKRGRDVFFSSGLEKFAEFYEIELGYFLIFDFKGYSFDVGIFDVSNCEIDYNKFNSQSLDHEEEDEDEDDDDDEEEEDDEESDEGSEVMYDARERAEQFPCCYPSFIITMKSSNILRSCCLWVPLHHAQNYLQKGESTVKLRVRTKGKERIWRVALKSTRIRFSAGWQKFVDDNLLRLDDVCKFELTDLRSQTYRVYIFRHDEEDEESDEGNEVMCDAREIAEQFPCRYPSFIITMKSSNVLRGCCLGVPLHHAQNYLQKGDSTVELQVGTAQMWRVWRVAVKSKPVRFSAGWQKFVDDNRLRLDDVCKFELTDLRSQTYWVYIFRHGRRH